MKLKILFLILFVLLFPIIYYAVSTYMNFKTGKAVDSPLSNVMQNVLSAQSAQDNKTLWIPHVDTVYDSGIEKPNLTAKAVIAYDLSTERLLYEKNSKQKLPIASLTKIMTAYIALENEDVSKIINISKNAATIGENSMGLSEGEIITLKDLLYGLILPSGNDAAEAVAEGSSVGRNKFVYLMNRRAQDWGAAETNFTNPSGLEGDGDQYSTAYDLLIITKRALDNPSFLDLVSTVEYHIPLSNTHKEYYLYNDTNLLTSYPGVKGVKTGFTDEAGLCLVTYLEYENHKIIAVLLNSQNRRQEMKDLLDYSLKTLGAKPPVHQ